MANGSEGVSERSDCGDAGRVFFGVVDSRDLHQHGACVRVIQPLLGIIGVLQHV